VFAKLRDWFDQRTGYRKLVEALLIEHIPGGAKWRYVWGSCLAFVFAVQLVTGVLLMTAYSPGDSTAWSSVYFIQYEMDFGWLIRGLHHFGSQTMVVLLGVHMLQVVIAGAHLPPREINWWLGLALLAAVLGLSLTGYLLPWDQKGYWATQVATNIAGNLPVAGPLLQKIVVGGPVYGHHTLTRFFTLHVAILPPLVIVLIIAHLTVFRRHGVTTPRNAVGEGLFWPEQAFRDMLLSMGIFAVMLGLVIYGHGHAIEPAETHTESSAATGAEANGTDFYERIAHAGRFGQGANLDAPADPSRPYPARPEWYFLFLFQLLKYFEGEQELIGTVVIPNGVLALLFLLPLLGYGRLRPFGHFVGVVVIVALLTGVATLTYLAIDADRLPQALRDIPESERDAKIKTLPESERPHAEKTNLFHKELAAADALAERAIQLARDGIPAEGAVYLLRRDPQTRGRELFKERCAVCHTYGSEIENPNATASDLKDWGTTEWLRGLLNKPSDPHYFGRTKFKEMAAYVRKERAAAEKENKVPELTDDWHHITEWLGSHPRGNLSQEMYERLEFRCLSCHTYKDKGTSGRGPDFTGYGDAEWLRLMLMAPFHELRYSKRNAMPAFRNLEGLDADLIQLEMNQQRELFLKDVKDDDPDAEKEKKAVAQATRVVALPDVERELIIRFVLKDNRLVFGGQPISGPPKPAKP
jgi:ubiquinol-cytochrome c reductase cytochrome b subunit